MISQHKNIYYNINVYATLSKDHLDPVTGSSGVSSCQKNSKKSKNVTNTLFYISLPTLYIADRWN